MKELFDQVSVKCSKITTKTYSTSFSLGILCLAKELRDPIYSVYGFVRFADEIVDSFHDYDKPLLLQRFREETYRSIDDKISMNPILNSFQEVVHRYRIEAGLIDQFLRSMEMDLDRKNYDASRFQEYVLGSAEVVGLMCLRIFTQGDQTMYALLKPFAMALGSAFQKVNFLRDLNADYTWLGRSYFPDVDLSNFDDASKKKIEASIAHDFTQAYEGIKKLPRSSRFGVYVAYVYYLALFRKIRDTPSTLVMKSRIRVDTTQKATLLAYSFLKYRLNMI